MDRRRETRLSVHLPCSYQRPGEAPRTQFFEQLSRNGCRLVEYDTPLVVGEVFDVTLSGIETLGAKVTWVRKHLIGVEFITPLDPMMLDFFGAHARSSA